MGETPEQQRQRRHDIEQRQRDADLKRVERQRKEDRVTDDQLEQPENNG